MNLDQRLAHAFAAIALVRMQLGVGASGDRPDHGNAALSVSNGSDRSAITPTAAAVSRFQP